VVGAAIIISPDASPLLPYNCCSVPFKSVRALLLHLFLPPQEAKLLACASLAIFSYCPSGLRGSFTTSLLYLTTVRSHCPSGVRGRNFLPLQYIMPRLSIINNHESITTFATLVEDLAHVSLDMEAIVKNLEHSIQEALIGRNLLSLPQLFAKTHG